MTSSDFAAGRLKDLADLWAAVAFFHPWLAYRAIDWDEAFARALPGLLSASDEPRLRVALAELLDQLEDDCTAVADGAVNGDVNTSARSPLTFPTLHVITVADLETSGDRAKEAIRAELIEATDTAGIVLDLRDASNVTELWRLLDAARAIGAIALRERVLKGWPRPGIEDVYGASFVVQDVRREPTDESMPPVSVRAAVVDGSTSAAGVLLAQALQAAGGKVIAIGRIAQPGYTTRLQVGGISVTVRTTELVAQDGVPGLFPDVEVAPSDEITEPLILGAARRQREPMSFAIAPPSKTGDGSFPSREQRLTGFVRLWNVIRYFFAYHALTDEPWDRVLEDYAPRVADADNEEEYVRAVAQACTLLSDSHVGVHGRAAAAVLGSHVPKLGVELIEGQPVITRVPEDSILRVGDVIKAVDGKTFDELIVECRAAFAASSDEANGHQVARRWMLVGQKDTVVELSVETANGERNVGMVRDQMSSRERDTHHAPGLQTVTILPSGLGYVSLVDLLPGEVDAAMRVIETTPGVVLDLRGYPNGIFPTFVPRFATTHARAAVFRQPFVQLPREHPFGDCAGETWFSQWVEPSGEPYKGHVAVLIDMNAISQSEHTALWLEAACNPTFVGSPTRGANGNVTAVALPGALGVAFTGLDTRHGDGRQLQRVGVQPHIVSRPTSDGIRAGRDEVLEAAVEHLLGAL